MSLGVIQTGANSSVLIIVAIIAAVLAVALMIFLFMRSRSRGRVQEARTRERILEGFFSTKEGGSGLGLTFVRRVVEAHAGRFRLDSALGKGTQVSLELALS